MKPPSDLPRRPPTIQVNRRRVALGVLVAALFFLLTSLRGIARFYTDYLWFDSLGLSGVWSGVLGAKVLLSAAFILAFFVVAWVNLAIADRLAPPFRPPGPEEEALERYREIIGHRMGLVRVVVAGFLAVVAGIGTSGQWDSWLLYRNSVTVGQVDPLHQTDLGFYLFKLPFLSFVVDWAFAALVVVTAVSALAHYVNGGIRFQSALQRVTPQVKMHLSVLLGVLALLRTADYWLQRFEITTSTRGVVDGASYTDVQAQLPALNLLVIVSVAAAILFLVNSRLKGWTMPVIAVGVWAFVSLVVATMYPAFIQRFRVEPAESEREAPYIERNIAATRAAFDLDEVEVNSFDYNESLTSTDITENQETVANIRLWEPDILARTYQRLQEVRGFYRFNDVDVDRYTVDGKMTQVMISARQLNPEGLPSQSWENKVLAYTHGYGVVVSPANVVTSDGQPDFLVKNVPPVGEPEITQPAVYYGEELEGYSIVNTRRDEIDFPTEEGLQTSRYDGQGGIGVGNFVRRAAFALRFGDINPIISNFMTGESQILFLRDVKLRASTAAPFLSFDADPYPVVLDGRIFWILDAYTTSSRYPYSQRANTERLPASSGLPSVFNYARNSVKVVVDAYHGSMKFYVVDDEDPIIEAYQRAFPKLFTPGDEAPAELVAHFRYPEDLFRVQTNMWGKYHIDDPLGFFSQSDAWNIAQDPGSGEIQSTAVSNTVINPDGTTSIRRERRMDPYYLLTRLPGEEREEFLIFQPFVPVSEGDTRKELSAFMVAKSDPANYGKLQVFVMPRGRQIDGPAIIDGRIQQAPAVSSLVTLLNQSGSRVLQGNLLVVPIKQSLLYVRPLYIQAQGTQVPELKKVVVVFGDRVVIADTLELALTDIFGDAPRLGSEAPPGGGGGGTELPQSFAADVQRAQTLLAEAQQALRSGDLATYQRKNDEAARVLAEAIARSQGPTTTTTPDGSA